VPEILRSGNHAAIAAWKRQQALERTARRRPDLLDGPSLSKTERGLLEEIESLDDEPFNG
jgi:tRNA (guanine37-N1)-methyltransferase